MTTDVDTHDVTTLDRRIIDALQRDGRATILDIAEQIDAPATTVQKRLKHLNESDIIAGYEPQIEYAQFGYELTAIFQLDLNDDAIEQFMTWLRNEPHIMSIYEVTGDFDVFAIGKYTDVTSMNEQIKSILTDSTIQAGNTSVVLDAVVENDPIDLVAEQSTT